MDVYTPEPTTLAELLATWAQRDSLYARRVTIMGDDEIDAVVAGRKREAKLLPDPADRRHAFSRAATWYPPEHGQGRL